MAIAFGGWCNEEGRNRRWGGKAGRNNPQKDAAVGAKLAVEKI
jgi:hypothetical protein